MSKVTTDKSPSLDSAEEAVAASPQPSAKGSGKKVVKVMYPNDRFVVEDVPVITTEGTELTAEQYKKVNDVAKANGVRLVEVHKDEENK